MADLLPKSWASTSCLRFAHRLAIVLLCVGKPSLVDAANASEPHPHQGVIPRLKKEGKPTIALSKLDLEKIEDGQLWTQSRESKGIGRGIGVRDIAAPRSVVYGQIADLEGYVGKVPMLKSLKVYHSSKKGKDIMEKATYVVKVVPGYNYEYYVEHHASKKQDVLLFFLDYDRYSDFNDLQGKWYLEDHPTKTGWTRVYYQVDLMLFGYAPKIVKTLLTSQGLVSAIGWVKRESEKRAPKLVATSAFLGPVLSEGGILGSLCHADDCAQRLVAPPKPTQASACEALIPFDSLALAAVATWAAALRNRRAWAPSRR